MSGLLNELMSVCRTALATPGLLKKHRYYLGPLGRVSLVVVMFIFCRLYVCRPLAMQFISVFCHKIECRDIFAAPKRGGLHEAFQTLSVRRSVRLFVRPSISTLVCVLSYTAYLPRTPNILTDSGPPIKK